MVDLGLLDKIDDLDNYHQQQHNDEAEDKRFKANCDYNTKKVRAEHRQIDDVMWRRHGEEVTHGFQFQFSAEFNKVSLRITKRRPEFIVEECHPSSAFGPIVRYGIRGDSNASG